MGMWMDGHGVLTFAGYAAAVLLVGAVLHHGVERPFLRLRERYVGFSRTRPVKSGVGVLLASTLK